MKNNGKTNKITNAYEAAICFGNIWDRHEGNNNQCTYAIFLNTEHEFYAHKLVSIKGLGKTTKAMRKVLQFAQDNNLANVILARNTTQTVPKPSKRDICSSVLVISLCKPEGVNLIDYLIINFPDNKTNYFSLRETGLIV